VKRENCGRKAAFAGYDQCANLSLKIIWDQRSTGPGAKIGVPISSEVFKMLITAAIGAEGDDFSTGKRVGAVDLAYDSGRPVAGSKFIYNF